MRLLQILMAGSIAGSVIFQPGTAGALALWCGLTDASRHQAYFSDVRSTHKMTSRQIRELASRFRRTINGRYDTFYGVDAATCSLYPSTSQAALALAVQRDNLQRLGFSTFVVEVF